MIFQPNLRSDRREQRDRRDRIRRPRAKDRQGAYAVEFAFCCSIFFMSVFACLELSRYLYVRQALDQTAYEACREGIVRGASAEKIYERANELLGAYGVSDTEIVVQPTSLDDDTLSVTVTLHCDFTRNSWLVPNYVHAGQLEATITLDHENAAFVVPEDSTNTDDLTNNDEPLDT